MKVEELTEEQREALAGEAMSAEAAKGLCDAGLIRVFENLSGGSHGYSLTPAGIALRDELMKEANDEDV